MATHWNKGKNHEDASENELISALGICFVDVVHVARASNDLHGHTEETSHHIHTLYIYGLLFYMAVVEATRMKGDIE